MKYKGIKDLKVGDTCYVFTNNYRKISIGKIINVTHKYSTWFNKLCLFITYSCNGIEHESQYPPEQLNVSWIGGPLIADLQEAKKYIIKCNNKEFKKLEKLYNDTKQKYEKKLKSIEKDISELNKIIKHNNSL